MNVEKPSCVCWALLKNRHHLLIVASIHLESIGYSWNLTDWEIIPVYGNHCFRALTQCHNSIRLKIVERCSDIFMSDRYIFYKGPIWTTVIKLSIELIKQKNKQILIVRRPYLRIYSTAANSYVFYHRPIWYSPNIYKLCGLKRSRNILLIIGFLHKNELGSIAALKQIVWMNSWKCADVKISITSNRRAKEKYVFWT